MNTVVMRRSDREKKDPAENFGVVIQAQPDDYPYGLRLALDDASLKKLAIRDMPKPRRLRASRTIF